MQTFLLKHSISVFKHPLFRSERFRVAIFARRKAVVGAGIPEDGLWVGLGYNGSPTFHIPGG